MATRRPNFVFVLTDDQGYGDLGCHGNDAIRTPNLDRFHGDAVRFTDFHVGTTCAPTRAGLLTGHFCNSAGVWHTIGGRSLLREDEWTLADALRGAGYRTGQFGKWHLGDSQPFRPHERGFERAVYHNGGGIGNIGDAWGNDYFDDTYYVNGVPTKFEGYCTDVFFREGLRFIEQHRDEPFYCHISTNAPHGPLNVEPHYASAYADSTPHEDRARFYGMITNIDDNFGLLVRRLDELGLADDTIVVFMTDNGTATGVELDEHGYPQQGPGSFNAGMRGKKGSPYDGGHRVPFFLRYPGAGVQGGRDVRRAGRYGIELRRWPEDAGYALDAGIDGDDVEWRRDAIQAQHTPHYSGGVALPIGWAALTVGGRSYHRETPPGDTAAVFEVPLEAGPDRLSAAFHDRIERTIGSYYVTIHPTSG